MSALKSLAAPRMLYGTAWKQDRTTDLVVQAITAGFRGIDTAAQPKHYKEKLVGDAVRITLGKNIVSRPELYLQTKFTSVDGQNPSDMPYDANASLEDQVCSSIASSLRNFKYSDTEPTYLDCVVLHSPMPTAAQTLRVWRTLESYVPHSVKSLGISNVYQVSVLEELYAAAHIKPSVVQNRFCRMTDYCHDVRKFCAANGIVFQSFWTLTANPELLMSAPVVRLARVLGISREAALYNLTLRLEYMSILNGTTNFQRMREDLASVAAASAWAAENVAEAAQLQKDFEALL